MNIDGEFKAENTNIFKTKIFRNVEFGCLGGRRYFFTGSKEDLSLGQLMDTVIHLNLDSSSLKELSELKDTFKKMERSEFSDEPETQSNSIIQKAFKCFWGCISKLCEEEILPFNKLDLLIEEKFKILLKKALQTIDPSLCKELSYAYAYGIGCRQDFVEAMKFESLARIYNHIISEKKPIEFSQCDIWNFLSFIEKSDFDLSKNMDLDKDQRELLFKIIECCTQKYGQKIDDMLKKVGFTGYKDHLIACNITKLGLTDPNHLFEIAKLCAQQKDWDPTQHLANFNITDPDQLFEIAKLCATVDNIKSFGITDQDHLFEIVKICAQKNVWQVVSSIATFGITDQDHLFEIAKHCAQQKYSRLACDIKNFKITDPDRLFEIAKLCAQQDSTCTACAIKNFKITDPDRLFEIAKLCAQQLGSMHDYLKVFCITDPDRLFEIAKHGAQDGRVACYIARYKITDPDRLFEIAKLCAQQNGEVTAHYIKNFGITDHDRLFEIAKLCAQQDGKGTACNIKNFGITDQDWIFEIAKLCIQQPFVDLTKALQPQNYLLLQIFSTFFKNSDEGGRAKVFLHEYEKKEFANSPFKEIFTHIASIEEAHIRFQNYELLANVMAFYKRVLNDDQIECLKHKKILESIFQFGRPNLKFSLFLSAALLMRTSEGLKKFEALKVKPNGQKNLTQLLTTKLELEGIDTLFFLQNMEKATLFKAKENRQALIEMLLLMTDEETSHKQLVLERICSEVPQQATTTQREAAYLRNIHSVISIIEFKETDQFKDQLRPLCMIAEEILKKKLFCGDIDQFASKYNDKFRASRNPSALVTYASKIKDDKKASECLGTFITSTLNETFLAERYKLENNPHLQKLNEYDEKLIGKWKSCQSMDLSEININPSQVVKEQFSSKEWIEQKIAEKHLVRFQLDDLHAYLQGSHEKSAAIIKDLGMRKGKLSKELKQVKGLGKQTEKQLDVITLQLFCIQFIEVSDKTLPRLRKEYAQETDFQKKGQIDIQIKSAVDQLKNYLEQLQKIVSQEAYAPCEFSNDLEGKIEEIQTINKTVTADRDVGVETDDPIDLLLCGTEVSGSCQRIDGDPTLNKGLLGYLMDGKNKLLAIKSPEGTIKARCLLRLLWDGERPVLFMERLYPNNIKGEHRQALEYLARRKAEQLGLSLYSMENSEKMESKSLYALGGPSPYEYCDAALGITDGKYTIRNAHQLC